MNALIRSLACGFAIALFVSAVPPANGKLSGIITDQNGTALSEAFIVVHWDPSGSRVGLASNVGISRDLNFQSGKDGGYSIDLPPGFYDVFVSSMAFTPSCQKVRVRPGESARFNPKLTVSPVVTKELADKPF